MLAADTNLVLHDDPAVLNLARQIVQQRLGLGNGRIAGERVTSWPWPCAAAGHKEHPATSARPPPRREPTPPPISFRYGVSMRSS
jgi:hypothetical protein